MEECDISLKLYPFVKLFDRLFFYILNSRISAIQYNVDQISPSDSVKLNAKYHVTGLYNLRTLAL